MNRHIHFLPILALAAIAIAGCGGGDTAQAEADFNDGKFNEAAKALEKATRSGHATSTLYYNLGVARALAGDNAGALSAFENAQTMDISAKDAAEYRAHILIEEGQYDDAHDILDGLESDGDDPARRARILSALAVCEHRMGRNDLAFLRLVRAIDIDPSYAPASQNLAVLLAPPDESSETPPPRKSSAEAAELIRQGSEAFAQSKWQLALDKFEKAQKADPTQYDPVFWQAHVAYTLSNPTRAAQILCNEAIPRWPSRLQSYERACYAWAAQKRFYEAKAFGAEYIRRSKSAGNDVQAFEKWFAAIPDMPLQK